MSSKLILDALQRFVQEEIRQHVFRDHARLLPGQVSAVDTANKRVSVKLMGSAVATTNIPHLLSYTPTVNDYVAVLCMGSRSYLVLGATNMVV